MTSRTVATTLAAALAVATLAVPAAAQSRVDSVRITNPPSLPTPRGYSHVAEVPASARLVFVAGQVAIDSAGRLVGPGDVRAQATQVFENLRRALAAAGASFGDVVKLTYYVLDAGQAPAIREVRDRYVNVAAPPTSTLVEVRRLFRDDVLLEIEAVAAVPGRRTP